MGNATHCLILHTNMNNIDMRRIGRCVKLPYSHGHVYISQPFFILQKEIYSDVRKKQLQHTCETRTTRT